MKNLNLSTQKIVSYIFTLLCTLAFVIVLITNIIQGSGKNIFENTIISLSFYSFMAIVFFVSGLKESTFNKGLQFLGFVVISSRLIFLNAPDYYLGEIFTVLTIATAYQYDFLRRHFYAKVISILVFIFLLKLLRIIQLSDNIATIVVFSFKSLFIITFFYLFLYGLFYRQIQAHIQARTIMADGLTRKYPKLQSANTICNIGDVNLIANCIVLLDDYVRLADWPKSVVILDKLQVIMDQYRGKVKTFLNMAERDLRKTNSIVDLNELINKTLTPFKERYDKFYVGTKYSQEPLYIQVNEEEISNSLKHLFQNSFTAMQSSRRAELVVITEKKRTTAKLLINDTGGAIPDIMGDIEPDYFLSGKTAKRVDPDVGLVYAITYIQSNKGTLEFETLANSVQVQIRFPLVKGPQSGKKKAKPSKVKKVKK